MSTNGNDAAHPHGGFTDISTDEVTELQTGLTKREYFAAMAMQGLLSDANLVAAVSRPTAAAVEYADDLIDDLNKTK